MMMTAYWVAGGFVRGLWGYQCKGLQAAHATLQQWHADAGIALLRLLNQGTEIFSSWVLENGEVELG